MAPYVEVFSFSLELGRGVDPVGHDPGDRLLHVVHPLGHLSVAHLVDFLNKNSSKIFVKSKLLFSVVKHPRFYLEECLSCLFRIEKS